MVWRASRRGSEESRGTLTLRSPSRRLSFGDLVRQFNDYLGALPETLGTLAMFGGIGCVVVVAIGIYGLVAFEMRQRVGEYAVRLALGARVDRLLRLVVRRVCLLIVPGALVGLVLCLGWIALAGVVH